MRKLIVAALMGATMVTGVASAQTPELRQNRRDVREAQRDLRDAQRWGDRRDVRDAREDLRDARQEQREDWRDYRRTNRAAYRMPAYVGPQRGWRYRPVTVGYRFQPSYYGQRYWIDAPRYRLPAARAGARWIRYGDDVALVNVRTGRVLQVYNNFFWR
ncbi:RcnB family protein [Sphingomonas jatrophae]|uniref:Nickel/cobalt transporter regulator n=1 Tax=Sphingomonas jatrophae TaxID=1166337 RepID=A0A1I6LM17_9SPHN|nr:RcnB family protein [Sphingomonas jatrophae]SFS04418.1 Nickel/cobalt transporter regulator [Sphingomonas jatrophae]